MMNRFQTSSHFGSNGFNLRPFTLAAQGKMDAAASSVERLVAMESRAGLGRLTRVAFLQLNFSLTSG